MAYEEMTKEALIVELKARDESLADSEEEVEDLEEQVEDLEADKQALESQVNEYLNADAVELLNEEECRRCGRFGYVAMDGYCSKLCREGFRIDPRVFGTSHAGGGKAELWA